MHVCACVYIYIYIYMYTHTHVHNILISRYAILNHIISYHTRRPRRKRIDLACLLLASEHCGFLVFMSCDISYPYPCPQQLYKCHIVFIRPAHLFYKLSLACAWVRMSQLSLHVAFVVSSTVCSALSVF